MKRAFAIFIAVIMILCLCIPVMATSRAIAVSPQISFTGTTANCSTTITALGQEIEANLELWYNGYMVKSWPGSGKSYVEISGTRPVISGYTYSVRVTGTVDGVAFQSNYATGTCP